MIFWFTFVRGKWLDFAARPGLAESGLKAEVWRGHDFAKTQKEGSDLLLQGIS